MSGWDIAFYVVMAALVYSLVRPGSPAHEAIVAISNLMEDVVGVATGYDFTT